MLQSLRKKDNMPTNNIGIGPPQGHFQIKLPLVLIILQMNY